MPILTPTDFTRLQFGLEFVEVRPNGRIWVQTGDGDGIEFLDKWSFRQYAIECVESALWAAAIVGYLRDNPEATTTDRRKYRLTFSPTNDAALITRTAL